MTTPSSSAIQDNADFQRVNRDFAHVGKKLELLWGYPEFGRFVQQLQHDTRQGARAGFPAEIQFALLKLVLAHEDAFPALAQSKGSPWGQSNFR
ncbi:MAG: hypothetical protein ABI434_03820 [Burkholderiaceae bacterium]